MLDASEDYRLDLSVITLDGYSNIHIDVKKKIVGTHSKQRFPHVFGSSK